jgi:hypothetical protein
LACVGNRWTPDSVGTLTVGSVGPRAPPLDVSCTGCVPAKITNELRTPKCRRRGTANRAAPVGASTPSRGLTEPPALTAGRLMPTQPHPPTPPPGEGPAERRFDAAYNQARRTGDLLTMGLLDEAWSAALREIRRHQTRPV